MKNYGESPLMIFKILAIFSILSNSIRAQSLPKNNFLYSYNEILHDAGKNWESLSLFEPINMSVLFKNRSNASNIFINKQFELFFSKGSIYLKGLGYIKNSDGFYIYANPVIKSSSKIHNKESSFFPRVNEQNLSGLGFQNDWVTFQIGKGTESWGAGNNIQLALSDHSDAYDYLLLGSDYGRIRVRYVHGFLENVNENINRYLTARGFEWTNRRSLIIGFSETVIYSGKNRSFDFGYLNPIASHLEIESNDRVNAVGNFNSNAVWQIHMDLLLANNIRFSFNYLIDELVIDKEIELGKENGTGSSFRLAYTPFISNQLTLSIYSSIVRIGTPTFRHSVGTNNFVHKGRPLGWYQGSDAEEYLLGFSVCKMNNIQFSFVTGFLKMGDESTIQRSLDPYEDYIKDVFPSGNVKSTLFSEALFYFSFKDTIVFSNSFRLEESNNLISISMNILF